MRNLLSTLLFFFISIQINATTLDASDNNKITKHFNAYVDNGSLPNISILIKKDNKEIPLDKIISPEIPGPGFAVFQQGKHLSLIHI